jgi:hypothetical protein
MKEVLKKKENEPQLFYNMRKLFIDILKPKNKKQFSLYDMYSNIFINMIFLRCTYQKKTEDFIKDFFQKNKKKFTKLASNNIFDGLAITSSIK